MKRTRDEIFQTIATNEQIITDCDRRQCDAYNEIERSTVELDNCDLQRHQADTLVQFEVWKNEFLKNYEGSDYYSTLQTLLSNTQHTWTVKCNSDGQDDNRFYSNRLLLSLNNTLFFNMMYYVVPNDCLNTHDMYVSCKGHSINLSLVNNEHAYCQMSSVLGLDRDVLFDVIGLCYFTFMFHPQHPSDIYCPASLPTLTQDIIGSFGQFRCKNDLDFASRYSYRWDEKRLKSLETPVVEFMPLYDPKTPNTNTDDLLIGDSDMNNNDNDLPSNWCGTETNNNNDDNNDDDNNDDNNDDDNNDDNNDNDNDDDDDGHIPNVFN